MTAWAHQLPVAARDGVAIAGATGSTYTLAMPMSAR